MPPSRDVSGVIERVIADVPAPRTQQARGSRAAAASEIARNAAQQRGAAVRVARAAAGPARHADGAARPLPDLEDPAADGRRHLRAARAHGGAHRASHMLYCLFRHMASQVLRDVVVRAGERAVVRQLSSAALIERARKRSASPSRSASPARRPAAGCRWPAPRPSAPTRTGTRCRSRRPRAGCSDAAPADASVAASTGDRGARD